MTSVVEGGGRVTRHRMHKQIQQGQRRAAPTQNLYATLTLWSQCLATAQEYSLVMLLWHFCHTRCGISAKFKSRQMECKTDSEINLPNSNVFSMRLQSARWTHCAACLGIHTQTRASAPVDPCLHPTPEHHSLPTVTLILLCYRATLPGFGVYVNGTTKQAFSGVWLLLFNVMCARLSIFRQSWSAIVRVHALLIYLPILLFMTI